MPKAEILEKNELESLDPKDFIIIKGAQVNNLNSLDVAIPRNKLIVIGTVLATICSILSDLSAISDTRAIGGGFLRTVRVLTARPSLL